MKLKIVTIFSPLPTSHSTGELQPGMKCPERGSCGEGGGGPSTAWAQTANTPVGTDKTPSARPHKKNVAARSHRCWFQVAKKHRYEKGVFRQSAPPSLPREVFHQRCSLILMGKSEGARGASGGLGA